MVWLQTSSGCHEIAEIMSPTPVQVLEALVYIQTVFHVFPLCGTFQQLAEVSSALAPDL